MMDKRLSSEDLVLELIKRIEMLEDIMYEQNQHLQTEYLDSGFYAIENKIRAEFKEWISLDENKDQASWDDSNNKIFLRSPSRNINKFHNFLSNTMKDDYFNISSDDIASAISFDGNKREQFRCGKKMTRGLRLDLSDKAGKEDVF